MQNSKIEWTTHTFNIVWGCIRVSPGCEHCYAETLANRYGYNVWGPAKTTERRTMSDNYWKQPRRWNAAALRAPFDSERPRVFCGSMCDVFEDHPTNARERTRLWETIGECDALDWLLLTKRPENILSMVPAAWAIGYWPEHVWIGTSVEDQKRADERIPELLKVPAAVRFLSCEPLLGPVDLWHFDEEDQALRGVGVVRSGGMTPSTPDALPEGYDDSYAGIDWVICGGESGPKARSMSAQWARHLRDQCQVAGVAYFFKQWGEWLPLVCERDTEGQGKYIAADGRRIYIPDLLAHAHEIAHDQGIIRFGKHAAGRLLDGRTWDEFPAR